MRAPLALTVVLAALALAPAAHAADAEIREQPRGVQRTEIVRIEWAGGSSPTVVVERRHGLRWVTEARDGTGDVLVADAGEGVWSARWQPTYYSPSGTYRIRVEGADYALTSSEFRVRPCDCVIPRQVRADWRNGRFRLRVAAEYAPRRRAAGLSLLPTWVTTGRPVVRVLRDGRRVGSVLMRYDRGRFRGIWPGPRGPRHSVVFQLVSLSDGFGNR